MPAAHAGPSCSHSVVVAMGGAGTGAVAGCSQATIGGGGSVGERVAHAVRHRAVALSSHRDADGADAVNIADSLLRDGALFGFGLGTRLTGDAEGQRLVAVGGGQRLCRQGGDARLARGLRGGQLATQHDGDADGHDQRREQVDRDRGMVQIDGIGKVRFRVTEPLIGRLRSVTVRLDSAGRWFAAFTADRIPVPATTTAAAPAIGIDLGLKDAVVLSNGGRVAAPKPLKAKLAKLRRYQRSYARQRDHQLRLMGLDPKAKIPKGTRIPVSHRGRKNAARIGRLHAQVADQRREFQHQRPQGRTRRPARRPREPRRDCGAPRHQHASRAPAMHPARTGSPTGRSGGVGRWW